MATAVQVARARLAVDPQDIRAQVWLVRSLLDLSRFAEAQGLLEQLLSTMENRSTALKSWMAELYEKQGDLANAEEWHQQAVESSRQNAGPWVLWGATLARAGQLREAEEKFRQGTDCAEGAVDEAWYNLGLVLRANERYQAAAECFERALTLDPGYTESAIALEDVRRASRGSGLTGI